MAQTSFAVAFLGGLAALFSPCAAMLLPSFFAFAFTRTGTLVGRIALFFVGLLATLVPLGLAAGSLGRALPVDVATLLRIGAVLLIGLGALTLTGRSLPVPGLRAGADPASPLAIVVLGASYGLASGCTGPILGSVLTLAALGASPLLAALLMASYALGMVVPLLLLCLVWDRIGARRRDWLKPRPLTLGPLRTTVTQAVAGTVFILLGLFLLLTGGQAGALLDATRQYRLEGWLARVGERIGDLPVLLAVTALAGGLVWLWLDERGGAG